MSMQVHTLQGFLEHRGFIRFWLFNSTAGASPWRKKSESSQTGSVIRHLTAIIVHLSSLVNLSITVDTHHSTFRASERMTSDFSEWAQGCKTSLNIKYLQ